MSNSSRRTVLAILGLAPVSAVAGEDFARPLLGPDGKPTGFHFGQADQFNVQGLPTSRVAGALRRLADEIDSGGVLVQGMSMTSKVTFDEFLMHTISLEIAGKVDSGS